jgi:protease IV
MYKKSFGILIIIISILSLLVGIISVTSNKGQERDTKEITENRRRIILDGLQVFDKSKNSGIGVVYVYGGIYTADRGMLGYASGSDLISQQIQTLRKNDRVKAVVLRINSPGGSIAAIQEIYDEILKLKKDNIKVVVSMADIAASGSYYISAPADLIVANPGTITGSIGVFTGSVEFSELFKKIGVTPNIIVSGEYKDTLSTFREMRDDEEKYIKELVMENYEMFVSQVSEGRNINKNDLYEIADGRVFTGQKAKEYGLVDELGNFNYSLKRAAELSGLEHPAEIIQPSSVTHFTKFLQFIETNFSVLRISKLLNINSLPVQFKYQ